MSLASTTMTTTTPYPTVAATASAMPTAKITYTSIQSSPSEAWYNKPAIFVPIMCIVIVIICIIAHYLIVKFTDWGWIHDDGPVARARLRRGRNQRMIMELRGVDPAEQARRDRLVRERERKRTWITAFGEVGRSGRITRGDVLPRYEERNRLAVPPPVYEPFGRSATYESRRYFGGI